jgi:hypothetical protein
MKIGLLIPSRERLNLKLTLISSIITTVNDINNVNLYFGIDDDDPTKEIVEKIAKAIPFVKIIPIHNEGKFIGINRIWNILAENCNDEIFGYIGDDMIFRTPDWDVEILKEFNKETCPEDKIKMVHCWDGFQGEKLSVNAFTHRKYYEIMGYFCRPEFLINYSDSWMHEHFKAFNRIKYRADIYIEHNHFVFGKREKDKTSERMLSNNHDKISDALWSVLRKTQAQDIQKLSQYLNIIPDYTKIDPVLLKLSSGYDKSLYE